MFGVSFTELLVIFVVALLVLGPEKLPEMAARLGKLTAELKRTSDTLRREFYDALYKPAETDVDSSKEPAQQKPSGGAGSKGKQTAG